MLFLCNEEITTFLMCSILYSIFLSMSFYVGHDKMVDMQSKGSACRIKKCAYELLSIGSDLMEDGYSWDLVGRDIRLKSTFLYCDLSQLISSVPKDQKKALTELGNKLFCSIEEVKHQLTKALSTCL